MFRFQRTGRVKNAQFFIEAVQWAKEITEYINTKYPQVSLQVYTEVFSDIHTIYWHADYKDLATLESVQSQLMADQGYWAIVNKGMGCFMEGTWKDILIRSLTS